MKTLLELYNEILTHYEIVTQEIKVKASNLEQARALTYRNKVNSGICFYASLHYDSVEGGTVIVDVMDRIHPKEFITKTPDSKAYFKFQIVKRLDKRIKWLKNRINQLEEKQDLRVRQQNNYKE